MADVITVALFTYDGKRLVELTLAETEKEGR